ncbi:MAG: hypothetical protein J7K81_01480 [Methanophagales archaeon]|nr:hypothetical protein [Methanophagales archaeon]
MTNNDRTGDEVATLKKEVEYLKEKLNSVSESALSRDIETQKLKIHDLEETRIGASWLFRESKMSGVISVFLPLLPAMFALTFARAFVTGILLGQTEMLQALGELGLNFAPILNLAPLIVFIVVYALGFKITSLIAGAIVKHSMLKREKNKLRMLESNR